MPTRLRLLDGLRGAAAVFAVCAFIVVRAALAGAPSTRPTAATKSSTTRPADQDLAGWWRTEKVGRVSLIKDASGNGHDAKSTAGDVTVEKVGGRLGVRFQPSGAMLSAGTDNAFNFTSDYTVALWAKVASDNADMTLVSKSHSWAIVHGVNRLGGIGFRAMPQTTVPTPCKALDGWVHVAVTFRHKEFLLYIDGKAIGISELETVPLGSPDALLLGAGTGGKDPMDGWLDDVRIYRRALTAADVEALAAGREPASPYTPLAEAEVQRVKDLVKELGAESYARRERAAAELKKMGRRITPLLKQYVDSDDEETAVRVREILGDLPLAAPVEQKK